MDMTAEAKSMRLLTIYTRLSDGQTVKKSELARELGITQRSVQRDMESLRVFLAEEMLGREIIYDAKAKGYRLVNASTGALSKSEILAVCKILLESRSMCKDEIMPILDGLWELGQAVEHHRVMEVECQKLDGTPVKRTVEPLGIMFSEYYSYLIRCI